MSQEVTVDDGQLSDAINSFAAYVNKTVPEIVRAQARLVAVNLATQTQPFGDDDAAQFKGVNAVRIDLGRVFIGRGRVIEIASKNQSNGVAQWLKRAAEDGNELAVGDAWKALTGRSIEVGTNVNPAWHQGQRNAKGRVKRGAKPMIVLSESSLNSYTKRKEKLVGFGKSGWSACARALGGTRGIPGWVSRKKGPGTVDDQTRGQTDFPHVAMTNDVRYIDQILSPTQRRAAVRIQVEKMNRAIEHGLTAEAKKLSA